MKDSVRARGRLHTVLLAGGGGTRFWPMSRPNRPKQFLGLAGSQSLLRSSWERLRRLTPADRTWIVVPAGLSARVKAQIPEVGLDRLVVEPEPRDTAPAIALACASVARADPDGIVGIFPSDHVIRDEKAFAISVRRAAAEAERGRLVCLGIRPDRAATGFGYMRCAERPTKGRTVEVQRFVEKPGEAAARRYLSSGLYLWNGGMFVGKALRFLDAVERTEPGIFRAAVDMLRGRASTWRRARKISFDYGVLEKMRDLVAVPLEAGWDDVGTWDAAARLVEEMGPPQHGYLEDADGSVVFGEGRFVAVIGVRDAIVVDTPEALLILRRGLGERVRAAAASHAASGRGRRR